MLASGSAYIQLHCFNNGICYTRSGKAAQHTLRGEYFTESDPLHIANTPTGPWTQETVTLYKAHTLFSKCAAQDTASEVSDFLANQSPNTGPSIHNDLPTLVSSVSSISTCSATRYAKSDQPCSTRYVRVGNKS